MRKLLVILCILPIFAACRTPNAARTAQSEMQSERTRNHGMRLRPVIFLSGTELADPEKWTAILAAMERAGKNSLRMILEDASLDNRTPPVALFARALKTFDEGLAAEAASGLLQRAINSPGSDRFEMTLVMVDHDFPIAAADLLGTLGNVPEESLTTLSSILQIAVPGIETSTAQSIAQRIAAFEKIPIIYKAYEALAANGDAYRRIAVEHKEKWVVMLAKLVVEFVPSSLSLIVDTRIKPAFASRGVNENMDVVGISVMDYAPHMSVHTANPSVAQLTVRRTYRGNGGSDQPLLAKLRFGELPTQDVVTLTQCESRCRDEATQGSIGMRYPTIRGKFRPEGIANYTGMPETMKFIAAALSEYNQISILLRSVGIDLSNPNVPRVAPELSSFALVVGSGQDSILLTSQRNIEFQGFDLYNGILATKIANGLSDKVKSMMAEANAASAAAMARQLEGLAGLFGSGG